MSSRTTPELVALILTATLAFVVVVSVVVIGVVEIMRGDDDVSNAVRSIGTLVGSLTFGVVGYLLGIRRTEGGQ